MFSTPSSPMSDIVFLISSNSVDSELIDMTFAPLIITFPTSQIVLFTMYPNRSLTTLTACSSDWLLTISRNSSMVYSLLLKLGMSTWKAGKISLFRKSIETGNSVLVRGFHCSSQSTVWTYVLISIFPSRIFVLLISLVRDMM